jgi:hypothetical protein
MKYGAAGSADIVPEHSGCPAVEGLLGLLSANAGLAHG